MKKIFILDDKNSLEMQLAICKIIRRKEDKVRIYTLCKNYWSVIKNMGLGEIVKERRKKLGDFCKQLMRIFLVITEFSLYSIGVILSRLKKYELFKVFLTDTIEEARIRRIFLEIIWKNQIRTTVSLNNSIS